MLYLFGFTELNSQATWGGVLENEVFATGGETCGETKEALGANHAD
jgi:hypothetical protein